MSETTYLAFINDDPAGFGETLLPISPPAIHIYVF